MGKYKEELIKTCDTKRGFYGLLLDSSMHLDFLYRGSANNQSTSSYNNLIKLDCSAIKNKYFFKHLNAYFSLFDNLSEREKEKQILATMLAFNKQPVLSLCNYLDSMLETIKLTDTINILKKDGFANFVASQRMKILNSDSFSLNVDLGKKKNFLNIENQTTIYSVKELERVLNAICIYYEELNKSNEDYEVVTKTTNDISDSSEIKKPINYFNELAEKVNIPEGLRGIFNTTESYFDEMSEKYTAIVNSLDYDSQTCRYLRTLMYSIAYLTRNKGNNLSIYMKNITDVDVGWAVGDENNKDASFYGKSELAKAFAAYYAFMNIKENPYTELINNEYVSKMDYNAIMLHGYIGNNGVINSLLQGGETIKEVHKLLKNVRNVITILDTPITLGADLLGWLKGMVASITNSAAVMIDLSLGELAKNLFFIPAIPIGDKKYSIADIYNYINFIRLICENSKNLKIGTIDRDEFIESAYNYLGIEKTSVSKIGYFAYDQELNIAFSPLGFLGHMFQNQYDDIFTAKQNLKLFYSLLQFAIQKKVYLTGDVQFQENFNYSSIHLIGDTLENLNSLEVFYIFNLYGMDFYTLKKRLEEIDTEKMLSFNENLYNITETYNHNSQTFYEEYDKMDKTILYEKMLGHDFRHMRYNNLINLMRNYYYKVITYNKKQLDNEIFSANNMADIDDFFMRFIPSIIELGKTLGMEIKTFEHISDLLNSFCNLITDVLFKKLYLNLRINLNEIIKRYTDDMFQKIDFLNPDKYALDLDLGNNKFVRLLDKIIYSLENGIPFDLDAIGKCFSDFGLGGTINYTLGDLEFSDGTIGDSNGGEYPIGTNYPENPDDDGILKRPPEGDDRVHLYYEGEDFNIKRDNLKSPNKQLKVHKHEEFENAKYQVEQDDSDKKTDKIFYKQGNIILQKANGTKINLLTAKDNHYSFTEESHRRLPYNEFDKLVAIRDFIENVKDKELVHIQVLIKKEEERLENELNKKLPNYNVIKNINKKLQELTEELESVKNKNRTMYSESIVLKNIEPKSAQTEIDEYSYLNDFFNKESIIDEVQEIVIKNDSPLTSYQITELLK